MSPAPIHSAPRDIAVLRAVNKDGGLVCVAVVPLDDYFKYSIALLERDEYRTKNKIRSVTGRLYDSDGMLLQEFQREYDSHGVLTGGTVHQADGTVECC